MSVPSSASRILVVEDDPLVASTIGVMLRSIAAAPSSTDVVDTAARAVEALERDVRYSAIVLDVDLPDGNGLETVRDLRAVDAVPVIVLTSHDGNEIWGAAADAGAAAVLPKSALTVDRRDFQIGMGTKDDGSLGFDVQIRFDLSAIRQ